MKMKKRTYMRELKKFKTPDGRKALNFMLRVRLARFVADNFSFDEAERLVKYLDENKIAHCLHHVDTHYCGTCYHSEDIYELSLPTGKLFIHYDNSGSTPEFRFTPAS